MNKAHLEFCGGAEWAGVLRAYVIPWTVGSVDLGEHLLEAGPGPGATTEILRAMVPAMTAIEIDPELAAQLRGKLTGTNVTVVEGDATKLPFGDGHFSAAICLTMLHHVPTPELQDRLLAELARVVRPGGYVLGSDSLDSDEFRSFHDGDTCVPMDPATLPGRLSAAGLDEVVVETNEFALRFAGRVPVA
ncbi:MAG: class I SAM-dependent methyltransferase [Dehalococcoidia bacterium]